MAEETKNINNKFNTVREGRAVFFDIDGFEIWIEGYPEGWVSSGAGIVTQDGVEQRNGSYCAKLAGIENSGFMDKIILADIEPYRGRALNISLYTKVLAGSATSALSHAGGELSGFEFSLHSEWTLSSTSLTIPEDATGALTFNIASEYDGVSETYIDDMEITIEGLLININNKFNFSQELDYDIANKFNFVESILYDIANKFNTAILAEPKNISNKFHLNKFQLSNISNKFNMRTLPIYDITNNFRMMAEWQRY